MVHKDFPKRLSIFYGQYKPQTSQLDQSDASYCWPTISLSGFFIKHPKIHMEKESTLGITKIPPMEPTKVSPSDLQVPSVKARHGAALEVAEIVLGLPNVGFWSRNLNPSIWSSFSFIFLVFNFSSTLRSDIASRPCSPNSCISQNCNLPNKEGIIEGTIKSSWKTFDSAADMSKTLNSLFATFTHCRLSSPRSRVTPRRSAFLWNGASL